RMNTNPEPTNRHHSGSLPPCGGGLGWGVSDSTPHPNPPPQGGRETKAAWGLLALLAFVLPLAAQDRPKLDGPSVPTPQPVVEAMLKLAGVKANDTVYDLGCGDGRIVVTAVKQFGAKRAVGIDIDPARIKDSNENARKAGVTGKVEFKQGDVLKLE